jgi:hypothetical protein
MATKEFTTGQLIRRSLTPSGISGLLCVTIGLVLVIVHAVLLSINFGTTLPGVLDGQWSIAYSENVVQPLTSFFTNGTLNKMLVAVLWGCIGLAVYMGFEYGIHVYGTMKETQSQVALNRYGSYEERPMQQYFMRSLLWRVGVIVGAFVYLIAMQPVLGYAMSVIPDLILSRDLAQDGPRALGAALIWALFCHGCVVLMRLYTQRTRLFGDDKLY